jgi:hypothetical protein
MNSTKFIASVRERLAKATPKLSSVIRNKQAMAIKWLIEQNDRGKAIEMLADSQIAIDKFAKREQDFTPDLTRLCDALEVATGALGCSCGSIKGICCQCEAKLKINAILGGEK